MQFDNIDDFIRGMSRDQRQLFAEMVYNSVKDTEDYATLTEQNRELNAQAQATPKHFSTTRVSPKYETKYPHFPAEDAISPTAIALGPEIDMEKLEQSVRLFFEGIGDDPTRDGIRDTPKRVAKVWAETMNGYTLDPSDFVTLFDNDSGYSGPVILRGAEFYTKCEHHLEPFSGTLDLAYQPGGKIIGLSKLLRIARVYAKRPQNQERLTSQITTALHANLGAEWVAVRCRAEHYCMISRGVRIKGAYTETIDGYGNWPKDIFNG